MTRHQQNLARAVVRCFRPTGRPSRLDRGKREPLQGQGFRCQGLIMESFPQRANLWKAVRIPTKVSSGPSTQYSPKQWRKPCGRHDRRCRHYHRFQCCHRCQLWRSEQHRHTVATWRCVNRASREQHRRVKHQHQRSRGRRRERHEAVRRRRETGAHRRGAATEPPRRVWMPSGKVQRR